MKQIAQGAEAILYKEKNAVIKERFAKLYRLPQLDTSLRKFRTRREAKILTKLAEIQFPAPRLQLVSDTEMILKMDFIDGKKIKDIINKQNYSRLAHEIGQKVAVLHQHDIIHGDLTTSNMIQEDQIYFIDFGLSSFSDKIEDKAVDLFLLERALASTHYEFYPNIFEKALEEYKNSYPDTLKVLERLQQVKRRGRNKKKQSTSIDPAQSQHKKKDHSQ